jgi:hypothetical protein
VPGGPSCNKVERRWVKPAKVPPGTLLTYRGQMGTKPVHCTKRRPLGPWRHPPHSQPRALRHTLLTNIMSLWIRAPGIDAHLTASQTLCGVVITAVMPSIPRAARPVEAPTSRFDSRGCPFHRHLGPRAEEAGRTSATRLLQLAAPEGHERDMVPGIRDPQERPEGDQDS